LKRTSIAIDFLFFYFTLLKRLQSSEPLHAKINPTSCFFGSQFALNPIFLLAGALLFDEKSAEVLLYFGLDCGMLEFFTREP
jgi:hypothetical protein